MNIFQQFMEFMNAKGFCNGAEEQIDEHEDKEAAFARELAALLEKYGLELQDEEEENEVDDFESESDEERARADVRKGFEAKVKAKNKEQEGDADEEIEKAELRENKDEKKEYHNSSDFDYFKEHYNSGKIVKAAPSASCMTIDEQRKLGKEIF